ncbi:hypothetical protein ABKN59_010248 [Abortiporus biennis]
MFFKYLIPIAALVSTAVTAPVQHVARSFDVKTAAMNYVGEQWNTTPYYFVQFDSSVTGADGITYAFLRQKGNDQPIVNSFATVVFDADGNVTDFSSKYWDIEYVEDDLPTITPAQGVAFAEKALSGTWDGADPGYAYVAGSDKHLYWTFVLNISSGDQAYEAYISTVNGNVIQVINTATKAVVLAP